MPDTERHSCVSVSTPLMHAHTLRTYVHVSSARGQGLSARTAGLLSAFVVAMRDCFTSSAASSFTSYNTEEHTRMLQMMHLSDRVLDPRPSNLTPCEGGGEEEGIKDAHEVQQAQKLEPLTYQLSAAEIVGGSYSATLLKTVAGRYYTSVERVAGAHPSP